MAGKCVSCKSKALQSFETERPAMIGSRPMLVRVTLYRCVKCGTTMRWEDTIDKHVE